MTPPINEERNRLESAFRNLRKEITDPQGSIASAMQDLEVIVTTMYTRQEKMELALSEEMAKNRTLEGRVQELREMVHRVVATPPPLPARPCPPQVRVEHWAFRARW